MAEAVTGFTQESWTLVDAAETCFLLFAAGAVIGAAYMVAVSPVVGSITGADTGAGKEGGWTLVLRFLCFGAVGAANHSWERQRRLQSRNKI
jgi:hypothetical protein